MNQQSRPNWAAMAFATGGIMAIALLAANPAEARRGGYGSGPGYVVAESDFGNGTIRGAVRPSRNGWQVRLPRGTWIDCGRDCSDTLRRQTIDFWESNFRDAPGSGRGYLRWDFYY
jgi:hypothetical protein